MKHKILILPSEREFEAEQGTNLLDALRSFGHAPEAPCGGHGTCGKCRVLANGKEVLACRTVVESDMTIAFPESGKTRILTAGTSVAVDLEPVREGYLIAFDIGTTTVVCYLLDKETGKELASASMLNPQSAYGADVLARIQHAKEGKLAELTDMIRTGMETLIRTVCDTMGILPELVGVVSIVGNPAMQQLFLGIPTDNLAAVPFAPALTRSAVEEAASYLPCCTNAALLIVPDISGYVGADTIGCILSTQLYAQQPITLMVDIGTNGEMILGNRQRMVACSTAAGPALEGARIRFGMRGALGAIDHVWMENGEIRCSVIGNEEAIGICGSGLIDAVAMLLDAGILNKRGRIQKNDAPYLDEIDGQRIVRLTDRVYLTQEDIRELQLAKGAIAAGISLMTQHLGLTLEEIDRVFLAGAFGSFLNPESACRIGLLPPVLQKKIKAVGNAAGSGAKMLARSRSQLDLTQKLVEQTEFLELAELPNFRMCFAKNMNF